MVKHKLILTDEYVYDYRERIGKNIRFLREGKGYSQDQLAEIMEVQRSTISKIETGKFSITIDYLVKFGWFLDFDVTLVPVIKTVGRKNNSQTSLNGKEKGV